MPTYAYACTACDHRLDAVQSFSDDPLTVCPECGGRLRKVFGSVGVVFKGSGFYRTDSRASSAAGGSGAGAAAASNGSGGSEGSGGTGASGGSGGSTAKEPAKSGSSAPAKSGSTASSTSTKGSSSAA
jgi:putative FmdB family regulatory protein